MQRVSVRELAAAVHGRIIGEGDPGSITFMRLQRDSRLIQPGDCFLPLVGERSDGHRYIESALHAGAAGTLTAHEPEHPVPGKFYVVVEDTLKALGAFAAWYRTCFQIPVIGITGSAGKTTAKDMIASVLGEKYRVLKTAENYNNDIGLPETILSLEPRHEIAVIEMGMNHFDEIDYLTCIAKPDVAVIVNVGYAHIENLGSREGILKAKCEIFNGMNPDTGVAVLNGDDDMLATVEKFPVPVTWVGEDAKCGCRTLSICLDGDDTLLEADVLGDHMSFRIPAAGRHMQYSVLMAAAIGKRYGLTDEEIIRGVSHFVPSGKRMLRIPRGNGITIIDDTYNANPAAVKAVLAVMKARAEKKKIAVLGDMFELGNQGPALHAECGAAVKENRLDTLIAIGPLSKNTAEAAKGGNTRVYWFATKEEAGETIAQELEPDSVILFKASHGMQFASLVEFARCITTDA